MLAIYLIYLCEETRDVYKTKDIVPVVAKIKLNLSLNTKIKKPLVLLKRPNG